MNEPDAGAQSAETTAAETTAETTAPAADVDPADAALDQTFIDHPLETEGSDLGDQTAVDETEDTTEDAPAEGDAAEEAPEDAGDAADTHESDILARLERAAAKLEPESDGADAADTDAGASGKDAAAPAPESEPPTLADAMKALTDVEFSEQEASALSTAAGIHAKAAVQPLMKAMNEQFAPVLRYVADAVDRMENNEIRVSLRESYPEIDDKTVWDAIGKKASVLAKTGEFKTRAELLEAATFAQTRPERLASKRTADGRQSAQRKAGQPTKPKTPAPTLKTPKTAQDWDDAALRLAGPPHNLKPDQIKERLGAYPEG